MVKYQKIVIYLILVFALLSIGNRTFAQEAHEMDSSWNNWNFRISPYFWYIGFKGTIYKPPVPVQYPNPPPPKYDIDVGFKNIKNSIKFAIMLAGQYKNEHFVGQFNFASLILESEAITPFELLLQNNIINLQYFSGDLGLGYRVVKNPKVNFDALLGAKFIYFHIGLTTDVVGSIPVEGERGHLWIDPFIGTNLKYIPHRKVEIAAYGDFGARLLNDELSSQFMVVANYLFTRTFHISLGYRYYSLDIPKEDAIFSGHVKGWIMKVGFQF